MVRELHPVILEKKPLPHPGRPVRPKRTEPTEPVPVAPVLFTQPGEDTYLTNGAARPTYADFRPQAYPANIELSEEGEETPKVSSVPESAFSSTFPLTTEQLGLENLALDEDTQEKGTETEQESGKAVAKDNGESKKNETSTPNSSFIPPMKSGKLPPPVAG